LGRPNGIFVIVNKKWEFVFLHIFSLE
jgi:hypothetical protein